MGFDTTTRRRVIPLPTQARAAAGGNIVSWVLPKVGLLARLWVSCFGTLVNSGVAIAPIAGNPWGKAHMIRRIRLTANSGIDLVNISGVGMHYLLAPMMESQYTDWFQTGGIDAKVAMGDGATNISFMLPVALNMRDAIGLFMLQSEQTVLTLSVEFEADANLAANMGANAFPITPYMEVFSVPPDKKDWPELAVLHTILEESEAIGAATTKTYYWPRGGNYVQVVHGAGLAATTPADAWTRYQLRVNQSEYLYDAPPDYFDLEALAMRAGVREPGTIPIDFMATSGLGMYGKARDLFNSAAVTDLASVVAISGATTFFTLRRQLIQLG